ncbi:MAG TPA: DUF4426 domain-containing protein [Rudaea sp.]|nr:DUF4426 domain-containing protein [Rudaea sp.]
MRVAHKSSVLVIAIVLLLLLLLAPRHGQGQQVQDFGDYVVHYNAISTEQLPAAAAKNYGIERSDRRGLINIAIERKASGETHMVGADVSAEVSDLAGHRTPIRLRETNEAGEIDYLGDFALDGSGAYVFTVKVTPPGHAQPYVLRFNHDYVID